MSVSRHKKLRWFDRGAAAFEQHFPGAIAADLGPDHPAMYVCPICLTGLNRAAVFAGVLTAEDVPPRSFGGRPLLLTCKPCNDVGGSKLDAHARRKENVRDLMRGLPSVPRSVRITVGDCTVRGTMGADGTQTLLRLPDEVNRPGAPRQFAQLVGVDKRPFNVTFTEDAWSELGAKISWLRSAYLTMVAIFGYRLVFDPAVEIVRRQILEPATRRMVTFTITAADADTPLTFRRIMKIHSPEWLNAWGVQFGPYCVVLPEPGDIGFYDRIADNGKGDETISGRVYEWPTEPMFGLDISAGPPQTGRVCPSCKRAVALIADRTEKTMIFVCPGCRHRWSAERGDLIRKTRP